MAVDKLPAPPVPADCDCTDLDGFMLNVERLMASELVALGTHEEVAAALFLWCRAWKQVPAASLPDDERVIAAFARLPLPRFKKIRDTVLRGFEKCSDGRLYHRFLAKEAAQAYERKTAFRKKRETEAERLRKWRATRNETPSETHDETRFTTGTETRFVPEGQGQGQGQGQGPSSLRSEESSLRSETAPKARPHDEAVDEKPKPKRATRLATDWSPSPDDLAYAASIGIPQAAALREAERYRDFWIAKPGKDGVKQDWPATFRNWMRRFADDKGFAPSTAAAVPVSDDRRRWEARLHQARRDRKWWHLWGAMPGQRGCRVPPDLIRPGDGDGWVLITETAAA